MDRLKPLVKSRLFLLGELVGRERKLFARNDLDDVITELRLDRLTDRAYFQFGDCIGKFSYIIAGRRPAKFTTVLAGAGVLGELPCEGCKVRALFEEILNYLCIQLPYRPGYDVPGPEFQ